MGKYRITIEGVGCHHNDRPEVVDSNDEAQALVDKLNANGHSLTKAEFALVDHNGAAYSTDNLLDGSNVSLVYTPKPSAAT